MLKFYFLKILKIRLQKIGESLYINKKIFCFFKLFFMFLYCIIIVMNELKQIVANNIAELRKMKKMTQIELADKINYSDKAVSKWERAESIPDVEVLKNLSEIFGVTVDYLLTDNPTEKEKYKIKQKNFNNKIIITALAVSIVWIFATSLYVYFFINYNKSLWMSFVWAVPVSTILLIIFNAIWGKKRFSFYINSLLLWSVLASIYLQVLSYNFWLLFLTGVPMQVAIVLWSKLK